MFLMIESYFGNKRSLIRWSYSALFVKQIKNTQFLVIDKLYNFYVVFKINLPKLMLKFLRNKILFFQFENLL